MRLSAYDKKAFMYEVIDEDTGEIVSGVMEADDETGTYVKMCKDEKGNILTRNIAGKEIVVKQQFQGNIRIALKKKYENFKVVSPEM